MLNLISFSVVALALLAVPATTAPLPPPLTTQYDAQREQLLQFDSSLRFDRDVTLSPAEQEVNTYLKALRAKEGADLNAISQFPPALRFPEAKPIIDKTRLFSILKDMPKGGYLHGHLEAMIDIKWMIKTASEQIGNCYLKFVDREFPTFNATGKARIPLPVFNFSSSALPAQEWSPCQEVRSKHPGGPDAFDRSVELQNSVILDQYPTEDVAWARFGLVFDMLGSLIHYQPMYEAYIKQILEKYHQDGVTYIELRTSKWDNYDANGIPLNFTQVLDSVRNIVTDFKKTRPGFQDLKFIYQDVRFNTKENIEASLKDAISLRKTHASQIVGFDLVGQEKSAALADLSRILANAKGLAKDAGVELPYMFHAGETLVSGPAPDANLLDAYLLGTKRIGHGVSLIHHQRLIERLIKDNVAVEVAPISNTLLGYVGDMRRHPVIDMLLRGVQVTLASDDPSVFDYEGVSYDYYQVFMSFETLNLASLKKIAMNGITFAGMAEGEKQEALAKFQGRWDAWISSICA